MVLRLYFVLWIISSSPGGAGKSFESVSLGYKKYHSDACSTTTELWVNEDDKIFHNFYFIHWYSLRIHHFWVQSQHSLDDELLSSIYSENSYLATHKFKSSIQVPIDMWTVCWRAHEEKYNDRAMINFIPTEDKRKCAACQYGYLWCFSAWSQHALKWTRYRFPRCEHFGFSIQVAFSEVRKCYLRLLLLIIIY